MRKRSESLETLAVRFRERSKIKTGHRTGA